MFSGKRVLAVTLARGGSKRIPSKNIAPIAGLPLLYYTFHEAQKSKYIDKYIVSTEDTKIASVCREHNIDYHKRPNELALDTTTSAAALIDVVECFEEYDIIVELMATNPLKSAHDIDCVIEKLVTTGSDSVVSVVRVWDAHPSRVKYIEDDRLMDFYPEIPESRRQDLLPPAYIRNGSIYSTTRASLISTGRRLGRVTRPYVMPSERSINIDEPIDLYIAQAVIEGKRSL